MEDRAKPGDVLFTTLPGSTLSEAIIRAERRLSPDKQAHCSHVAQFSFQPAILLDTRWKFQLTPFKHYQGRPYAIYRPLCNPAFMKEALRRTKEELGASYPYWRLPLHLLGLADNIHWDNLVCSERVCRTLHWAFRQHGVFDFEKYYGKTPDWLYDYVVSHPQHFQFFKEEEGT